MFVKARSSVLQVLLVIMVGVLIFYSCGVVNCFSEFDDGNLLE